MIKKILPLIGVIFVLNANAQIVEVDNYVKDVYEGKSYYYRTRVTLKPGFSFKANGGSTFFAAHLNKDALYLPPTPDANFVRTEQTMVPGIKTQDDLTRLQVGNKEKLVTYTYSDGLARPIQNINVQASPALNDIVTPSQYDTYGRTPNTFLPYVLVVCLGLSEVQRLRINLLSTPPRLQL
jgi:hypothetical protein